MAAAQPRARCGGAAVAAPQSPQPVGSRRERRESGVSSRKQVTRARPRCNALPQQTASLQHVAPPLPNARVASGAAWLPRLPRCMPPTDRGRRPRIRSRAVRFRTAWPLWTGTPRRATCSLPWTRDGSHRDTECRDRTRCRSRLTSRRRRKATRATLTAPLSTPSDRTTSTELHRTTDPCRILTARSCSSISSSRTSIAPRTRTRVPRRRLRTRTTGPSRARPRSTATIRTATALRRHHLCCQKSSLRMLTRAWGFRCR